MEPSKNVGSGAAVPIIDIDNIDIDALKQRHGDNIFIGEIALPLNNGKIEFIMREPRFSDWEVYQKASSTTAVIANSNLLRSLIVYPENPGPIIERVQQFPVALGDFVVNEVMPFFGSGAQTTKRKL